MIQKEKILCVIPQLTDDPNLNPGGQITAANGLINYLHKIDISTHIINTVSPSFPSPSLHKKVFQSLKRIYDAFFILRLGKFTGAILFTGVGLSLIERLVICLICRLFRVKNILFFRNSGVLDLMNSSISKWVMRNLLSIPTTIAVQGRQWKQKFVEAGVSKNRVVIIPNWLPPHLKVTDSEKSISKKEIIHFIFIGWVVKAKGIKTILSSIKELSEKNIPFRFTIVGGGSLEEWVKEYIKKQNWSHVEITGWKSSNEVYEYLKKSHVFVLPTYHKEGFPNALLEAMANGLPAISTNLGAISDSLLNGVNGFLVSPKDSTELAMVMQKYIESPNLIEQQSIQTLEIVSRRHDLNVNCAKLIEALLQ